MYWTARGVGRSWTALHASKRRRSAVRLLARGVLGAGVVGALVANWLFFAGEFPRLDRLTEDPPPTIGRIEDARGAVLAELAFEYRRPWDEQALPYVMRRALLSAEDKRFFEHDGVDVTVLPRIVAKAAAASYRGGRLTLPQGGSTITMQLVRIVFLGEWTRPNGARLVRDSWMDRALARFVGVSNANKLRRKVEEIRLAFWLERELTDRLGSKRLAKEEILRRYASYVYLGDGRYGFAAASEHYLGRQLASFDARDAAAAALLAGIPKNPGRYAPTEPNQEHARRRRDHVLALMAADGWLTEGERRRSEAQPVPTARESGADAKPRTVAAAVGSVLEDMKGAGDARVNAMALFEGRIRVRSTVDARAQALLSEALEAGLREYEARHPASRGLVQGSAVVLANGDARILALAGGRLVFRDRPVAFTDLNRVTDSRRQAGSAMKPIVYFAAFRRGAGLDSEVLDGPVAVPMGSGRVKWIRNYDGAFRGPIALRRALAESRNAATVRLAQAVGVGSVIRAAHDLGIHSELPPYVSTTLGAADVTLLELCNAYRTLASGNEAEPWIVARVTNADGLELFRHAERPARTLEGPALLRIQEALRGVVRLPGATAHSLASLPMAVMGKTGTTNDFRDALFVGSTFGPAGITVAVRIGFDDNRTLGRGETGGRVAVPVFRRVLEGMYRDGLAEPASAFPAWMERSIDAYVEGTAEFGVEDVASASDPPPPATLAEAPAGVFANAALVEPAHPPGPGRR
jgi:penicillin-binding protein 1A